MIKILMGFQYSEGLEDIRKQMIETLQSKGKNVTIAEKYNKIGVTKFLNSNKDYSVLIIQENIDIGTPLTIDYLDTLTDDFPDLRVVIILDNKHYKSQFIKSIFNLKIYNCIFEKDASIDEIVKYILKDRNKKETKFYYGINDTQDSFGQDEARTNSIISSVEISGIVEYLMSSSDDELFNNYEYITRKYSDKQNVDILINMPDILKEKLRENDKYILYESIKNNYVSLENKDEGFTPDNSSIKEKILLKEKIVYKVPKESKLKHVTIGVGGVSTAAGTTHTLLGIAMSLVRNKSKVAVVDRSNNLSIAELYSHGKPMKSDKYFKYMDIDFYVNANSTNDIFYEIKQKDYNYVLFDLGTLKSFNKDERRVEREKNYNEMFRMNHQILCLNGSLWKSQDIIYYRCDDFANLEPNISDWKLVISFADTKQYKKLYSEIIDTTVIKKTYRAPIYNPFKPNKDYEVFMDSLLSDIMPYKNKINKEFNLLGFLKK